MPNTQKLEQMMNAILQLQANQAMMPVQPAPVNTWQMLHALNERLAKQGQKVELKKLREGSLFDNSENYIAALEARGWYELGRGAYSTVLAHAKVPGKVIKVCRQADDDWPAYIMYVNSLKTSMAPKLYSYKKRNGFYVAMIERIATTGRNLPWDNKQGRAYNEIISHFQYGYARLVKEDDMGDAINNARIKFANKVAPGLLPFIRLLKKNKMCNDLHDGNWGVREDNSVVIFDPCTSVSAKIKSKFSSERYKIAA